MKKTMKIIFLFISVFFVSAIVLGIILAHIILGYGGYRGDYTDMYSVAVNNIFGCRGYLSNGEVTFDPDIHIVETDDYGRTLFFYSEYYNDSAEPQLDYGMAFVVMQKSENGYAYYYQDKCYVPYFGTTSNLETISQKIDIAELEQLKESNDWNKEIDNEKCEKVKIRNKKPEGKLVRLDYDFNRVIYPYEVKNGYTGEDRYIYKTAIFCETDSYGRELYYVYVIKKNKTDSGENEFGFYDYAIIFNSDGTCPENGIIKILNVEDSFALINELKQNNNWNCPD